MGYMVHHMIVVTSWDQELIQEAYAKAQEIFGGKDESGRFLAITPIITSPVNFYYSFFIPTDGSKEGWDDSDAGDNKRQEFVDWLNQQRFEDQSTSLDWALVQYGDDDRDNRILRHDGEIELEWPK